MRRAITIFSPENPKPSDLISVSRSHKRSTINIANANQCNYQGLVIKSSQNAMNRRKIDLSSYMIMILKYVSVFAISGANYRELKTFHLKNGSPPQEIVHWDEK